MRVQILVCADLVCVYMASENEGYVCGRVKPSTESAPEKR